MNAVTIMALRQVYVEARSRLIVRWVSAAPDITWERRTLGRSNHPHIASVAAQSPKTAYMAASGGSRRRQHSVSKLEWQTGPVAGDGPNRRFVLSTRNCSQP